MLARRAGASYSEADSDRGVAWADLALFAGTWLVALTVVASVYLARPRMLDGLQYWRTWHGDPYSQVLYPPPALLLFAPAAVLPWPAFELLWQGVLITAGLWLAWPLPVRLRVPVFVALTAIAAWGNVATLVAVPLALTSRWPMAWAAVGWIKITPAIGVVALVRQRRWRDLAAITVLSALIGTVLVAFVPDLVAGWIRADLQGQSLGNIFLPGFLSIDVPLTIRLPLAAAIAWFGASRPWTAVLAAVVATPDLQLATCGLLAAVPRLQQRQQPPAGPAGSPPVSPAR